MGAVVVAWLLLIISSGLAMDLAVCASENSSPIMGAEEKRWQPGEPVPKRRSNKRSNQTLFGSTSDNEDKKEDYFLQLQQNEQNDGVNDHNGPEQIVLFESSVVLLHMVDLIQKNILWT